MIFQHMVYWCDFCGGNHLNGYCSYPSVPQEEEVPYMNNRPGYGSFFNRPFPNNFSQGCRSYQNQGYGWNQEARFSNWQPPQQPQFPSLIERQNKIEDVLNKFMEVSLINQKNREAFQERTQASITNLVTQVGQMAEKIAEYLARKVSANIDANSKEHCVLTTMIDEGSGNKLDIGAKVLKRKENEGEKKESESEKDENEGEVENNVNSSVDEEKQKSEKERKEKEEADLRARIEAYRRKATPYPLVPTKKSKDQNFEEPCGKPIATPIPTLHTEVESKEVKTIEKVCWTVLPPPIEDERPRVTKRDVNNEGIAASFVHHPKQLWPNRGSSFNKHFGGRFKMEGRKYSSFACLMPP